MSLVLATELHKEKDAKRAIKKETYKQILEQVSRKIKNAAAAGKEQLVVIIPVFVMGCPAFDPPTAAIYIERQLKNGKYKTRFVNQVSILVDWGKDRRPVPAKGSSSKTERSVLEEEYQLPSLINLKKYAQKYNSR
tara:strand:- start:1121 stop:1528 length:408 start_codon:yes stop_codon:yes gene_type:complete